MVLWVDHSSSAAIKQLLKPEEDIMFNNVKKPFVVALASVYYNGHSIMLFYGENI